ncbi:hypothetical protein ACFQX9_27965 [Bradyrhizobium sp. GCM10028915]|uniref:hypothetical protein n=1 Tax=Bradyrhizobium sp. GCM10028915 TaxID=3273385 RepID=UPI00361288D0
MIKVIVVGLVCVGGAGAIAAATSKSAPVPTPSIAYPAVTGNKADRLSLISLQGIQPTVEQVALAYTPPSEPRLPAQPQPKEVAKASAPGFTPRHWHDPNDTRVTARKPKAESTKNTSRNVSATKLADAQDCRADGVSSILRKLNLQRACSR